ncbi:hypothetical protein K0M31_017279 [Melipona bicolor]|uniref:Uncharacterized protein n=1 Tax=Melipona bicolor TaxID=60889 RepID=A0AA40G4W4_9HYME|nr:hypothetical protein K0M31_017279 [Melipona bicolor]
MARERNVTSDRSRRPESAKGAGTSGRRVERRGLERSDRETAAEEEDFDGRGGRSKREKERHLDGWRSAGKARATVQTRTRTRTRTRSLLADTYPTFNDPWAAKSANDEEQRGGVAWVLRPAGYRTTVSPPAPAIAVNETGNYRPLGHPSGGGGGRRVLTVFSPTNAAATRCWGGRLQLRDALATAAAATARWRPADDGGGAALAIESRRRVATEGTRW